MPVDSSQFRSILGRFASGVTIVTARDGGGLDHGMTVSSFCSLSLEPPLVLACIEQSTEMRRVLESAEQFAVNVLSEDQEPLSRRFAELLLGRFDGIGFHRGVTGAPLLEDVLATLECEIRDRFRGGDHDIYVGEVIAGEVLGGRPLIYYRGGYTRLDG